MQTEQRPQGLDMPLAPKPGGGCQWAQPARGTPAGPLGSRAEAAGDTWARDRVPRWFMDLGFDPSPTRGARNHGANLPGGDLIPTYLKTVRFSRTQALHTPHFCPRVPPKSLGPIGATVQMRPLHRGAGLQLNTECHMFLLLERPGPCWETCEEGRRSSGLF